MHGQFMPSLPPSCCHQVIANEPGTYEVHLAVVPANASMFTKLVRGVVMFSETHTFVTVPKPRPKSRFLHSVLVSVAALGCLVGMVWVVWSLWFTDSDSASAWQAQAEDEPAYSNIPGDYAGGPSSTAPGLSPRLPSREDCWVAIKRGVTPPPPPSFQCILR